MKKLLISVLFFGSFGMAMAQAQFPWDRFRSAFGNLWVGPPVKIPVQPIGRVLFPNATRAINAVTNVITCATPDELAHCRQQGQEAEGEPGGVRGRTCSTSGRCHGVRPGHDNFGSNPCRPTSCSVADIRPSNAPAPLKITVKVENVTCTKPSPRPNPSCEKYLTPGGLTQEEILALRKLYLECLQQMERYYMPMYGRAVGSVSVGISGGNNGPYSANSTVEGVLPPPYEVGQGSVVVRDKNGNSVATVPVTLICPRPQISCEALNEKAQAMIKAMMDDGATLEDASKQAGSVCQSPCHWTNAGPSGTPNTKYMCLSYGLRQS